MQTKTQHIQFAASNIVRQVITHGQNLNQALDASLRRKDTWMPGQRAAVQDLSYGTLRHYGQLQAILRELLHKPLTDERIHFLLLVAMYQLLHGKTAPHAVVDHAVRAAHVRNRYLSGLVNATLRNLLREEDKLVALANKSCEGKYNYPQWWVGLVNTQYGERSTAILETGNQHPPMTLRVNRQRITAQEYISRLAQQNLSAHLILPDALMLDKPVPVDRLPGFFEGFVSVQDAGAQFAAHLLDVRDGMRVLDACCAPGGKTAHILERNAVTMVALDKDKTRLQRVTDNLLRLGLAAHVIAGDAAHPETWWDGMPFQRIMADVPCSASGVVRRHPDIKWLRRREDIDTFAAQQSGILSALWLLLAQDGKLLYVTCSIFRQENDQVIDNFLSQHPDARKLPITLPDDLSGQLLPNDQHDGFFYALLQKTA